MQKGWEKKKPPQTATPPPPGLIEWVLGTQRHTRPNTPLFVWCGVEEVKKFWKTAPWSFLPPKPASHPLFFAKPPPPKQKKKKLFTCGGVGGKAPTHSQPKKFGKKFTQVSLLGNKKIFCFWRKPEKKQNKNRYWRYKKKINRKVWFFVPPPQFQKKKKKNQEGVCFFFFFFCFTKKLGGKKVGGNTTRPPPPPPQVFPPTTKNGCEKKKKKKKKKDPLAHQEPQRGKKNDVCVEQQNPFFVSLAFFWVFVFWFPPFFLSKREITSKEKGPPTGAPTPLFFWKLSFNRGKNKKPQFFLLWGSVGVWVFRGVVLGEEFYQHRFCFG